MTECGCKCSLKMNTCSYMHLKGARACVCACVCMCLHPQTVRSECRVLGHAIADGAQTSRKWMQATPTACVCVSTPLRALQLCPQHGQEGTELATWEQLNAVLLSVADFLKCCAVTATTSPPWQEVVPLHCLFVGFPFPVKCKHIWWHSQGT